jgi:glycerol uptake facilitator-like aquaporin
MTRLLPKVVAEFAGTALLVCIVVGSGIMGTNLSDDMAAALLVNTASTIFGLALLILVLGPISGAHFNPAVSLVMLAKKSLSLRDALAYIPAQVLGAIAGAIGANVMFDLAALQVSETARTTAGTFLGEVIATAGLIVVILVFVARKNDTHVALAVAAWIGSAYFFTSSTSFANPAVTVGRIFSNTFAGIEPGSVAPFVLAQLIGTGIGFFAAKALVRN